MKDTDNIKIVINILITCNGKVLSEKCTVVPIVHEYYYSNFNNNSKGSIEIGVPECIIDTCKYKTDNKIDLKKLLLADCKYGYKKADMITYTRWY